MFRKYIKKAIGIAAAFLAAFLIVNFIAMFYERPVGWVDTPNGATIGIRRPNSLLVHGKEGYGIVKIDENGYTNSSSVLGNDYTLMLGSSNTQGKEIPSDKKYSEIVMLIFPAIPAKGWYITLPAMRTICATS